MLFVNLFSQCMLNSIHDIDLWDKIEENKDHPVLHTKYIHCNGGAISNSLLKLCSKQYCSNLHTLIIEKNYIENLDEFVNASSSDFQLKSLQNLQLQCLSFKGLNASSCILNKNFERLQTLHLSFHERPEIDFDEVVASSFMMNLKTLSLDNVKLGDKACLNLSKVFKDLEVISLKNCSLETISDSSILMEFPKLKVISISDMSDELIRPILDQNHPQYTSTNALRSRIEGISLENVKETTLNIKPSESSKEEEKKEIKKEEVKAPAKTSVKATGKNTVKPVAKAPVKNTTKTPAKPTSKTPSKTPTTEGKPTSVANKSFIKSILQHLSNLENLQSIRLTHMTIDYNVTKTNPFPKVKLLDLCNLSINCRCILERTQKFFPNLEELCMVCLKLEGQQSTTAKFSFKRLERACIESSLFNQMVLSTKDKKESTDAALERMLRLILEETNHLRYFEMTIQNRPATFNNFNEEREFMNSWNIFENKLMKMKSVDEIRTVLISTKYSEFAIPKIPKVYVSRREIPWFNVPETFSESYSQFWKEKYFWK